MISTRKLQRGTVARAAPGLALATGSVVGLLTATPALAAKAAAPAKVTFSPAFAKAAADLDAAMSASKTNAAVQAGVQAVSAATTPAAKAAAAAQVDTALGGAKAKLDAARAVASTPGDKLKLGNMIANYGGLIGDSALQHEGMAMMLDSGVLADEMVGKVSWLAGVTSYQTHDYVTAARYIQAAKDKGYTDPQLDAVLNDSYKRSNNPQAALANAQRDIAAAKAAGTRPSESSIRTALQFAYDAKQLAPSADLSAMLVQNYPESKSWNTAINVVRSLSGYQYQEMLDLLRLMDRTKSFDASTDYLEYVQSVDPRRFPGEAQRILDEGIASGKLRANDPSVADLRSLATSRIAADRASLPALERDSRLPSASAATVTGAADAFLSYGDAARAEALYTIALSKPGIDRDKVLTRLAIAQTDEGKVADAQANFAKVQGNRRPIAELWAVYAAQKAGKPAG